MSWSDRARFQAWRLRDAASDFVGGSAHRASVFERIHRQNLWGDPSSVSGTGSGIDASQAIRRELPRLFATHAVDSVLDAPCGDFFWMQAVAPSLRRYVGVDIVPGLIASNRERYESATVSFACADIVTDRLPQADLVLCRDCFIHLPTRLIRATLRNFRSTGARLLLVTTDLSARPYHDIPIGSFRQINFQNPPFCFPEPSASIAENASGRVLAMWDLAALPAEWVGRTHSGEGPVAGAAAVPARNR